VSTGNISAHLPLLEYMLLIMWPCDISWPRKTNFHHHVYLHFQHRNSRTFTIEILVHDSGRTLACAKYSYPKGSPNTNS
jgi:hypothetical protein